MEALTKGIEIPLLEGHEFHDKDGEPLAADQFAWVS